MYSNQIRLAFVGTGFVAQQCHLPCFASNSDFEIRCLADPYTDLAESLCLRYNVPSCVSSHKDICSMEDIDAVVVTLPRHLTFNVVLDLIKAGKYVFTEKPLSLSSSRKNELIDACISAGVGVMTGYMKTRDAGCIRFKQEVRSLLSDDLCSVVAYCHMGDSYASPFGDTKGLDKKRIEYNKQPFPDWLPESLAYGYEQFINVFSHITHLLEFVFNDRLILASHLINDLGEGHILCRIGSANVCLELIRGCQNNWSEGITVTTRTSSLRLQLPPAFLRNQPSTVSISSGVDSHTETIIRPKWSWSFFSQTQAFSSFIDSPISEQISDIESAFRQVEFAESLFKQISARL